MSESKKDPLTSMLQSCDLCWNSTKKVSDQEFIVNNERERKQFIKDMERAGVSFPIAEFETNLTNQMKLFAPDLRVPSDEAMDDGDTTKIGNTDAEEEDTITVRRGNSNSSDDAMRERVASVINAQLTADDYATNVPDDIKDMLRRMYAEDERLNNERTRNVYLGSIASSKSSRRWPGPFGALQRLFWGGSSGSSKSLYGSARLKRNILGIGLCCLALLIIIIVYGKKGRDSEVLAPTTQNPAAQDTESNIFQNSPSVSGGEDVEVTEEQNICQDVVRVDRSCYVRGDPIVVTFENFCNPASDDWLAIYDQTEDPLNLSTYPDAWVFTCGDKECQDAETSGTHVFEIFQPGSYQVHLIRKHTNARQSEGEAENLVAYASSINFDVKKTFLDCPSPLP